MDEPILILTDTSHNDVAAIRSFDLDMAFGDDEQDFVATFSGVDLGGGELLYIDGTEYGGIIDSVESRTDSDLVQYKGRTWHGMLAYKVITPPPGQTHYTVSGDANTCIQAVITKVGLGAVLSTPGTSSGITVSGYQFARFTDAYTGLRNMLASVGAKLCMSREGGTTVCWAEAVDVIADEADSDLAEFGIGLNHRVLNHLVCAGEGEMLDRVVVDLYADASGNVSNVQTFTGVDEIAAYYNYTGADLAELTSEGTKRLKESQSAGSIEIDVHGTGEWRVGDIIEGRDNRTGVTVRAPIVKKLVKVSSSTNYTLQVEYEAGAPMGASGGMSNVTEAGGGISYTAGTGISIAGNVIAVDSDDFAAVAFSGDYDDLVDAPSLATVATTGDYDDLLNTPAIPTSGAFYGTSSTGAGTAAKVVTATDFTMTAGYILVVKFTNANTANGLKLNVNSLGATSVYFNGAIASATNPLRWNAGTAVTFVYDGTYFQLISMEALTVMSTSATSDFVSAAATGYTVASGDFARWGKMAMVRLNITTDNAIAADTNVTGIVTLKSGYRPYIRTAGGDELTAARLNADGTIDVRILAARSAGGTVYVAFTYLLA